MWGRLCVGRSARSERGAKPPTGCTLPQQRQPGEPPRANEEPVQGSLTRGLAGSFEPGWLDLEKHLSARAPQLLSKEHLPQRGKSDCDWWGRSSCECPQPSGRGEFASSMKEAVADLLARRVRNPSRTFPFDLIGAAESVLMRAACGGGSEWCWREGGAGGGRGSGREACLRWGGRMPPESTRSAAQGG